MNSNFFKILAFINVLFIGSDLFCIGVAIMIKNATVLSQSVMALAVNAGAAWLAWKAAERNAQ